MIERNPVIPPETQQATLLRLLREVENFSANGQKAIVFVDLDLTALLPSTRTRRDLQSVGALFGVAEFAAPEELRDHAGNSIIPGYTEEAWNCFVELTSLAANYPLINWTTQPGGDLDAAFRRGYWEQDLKTDEVSPGLPQFCQTVAERGGAVHFVSGRPGTPDDSFYTLKQGGIPEPVLHFGQRVTGLPVPREHVRDRDADTKYFWTTAAESRGEVVVAVIGDRGSNRVAVVAASTLNPGALSIAIAAPGYSYAPDAGDQANPHRISSFRLLPEELEVKTTTLNKAIL